MNRRPAFTLLETMIALAIGIIVMGAAINANRIVQQNAAIVETRTQQESILNETFSMLQLTH